jgi:hypothetical protein
MTDIVKAITAIKSDAQVSVNAEDINQIIWHDGNPTNITNEQILAKQVELQADYDAKQYQRDREFKYPTWEDQLDMQYHDKVDGTTTWEDAVQAVKDAHPKP